MDPLQEHASTLPAWAVVLVALLSLTGTIVTAALAYKSSRGVANTRELVEETHHQVTVNHHSSDRPTVLDRIDDVAQAQHATDRRVEALAHELAEHKAESAVVVQLLTSAMARLDRPA